MKLGLNGSTTHQCTLMEDIEVAHAAGFDIVELRTYKIKSFLENGGTVEELRNAFRQKSIHPLAINALEFFSLKESEDEVNAMLQEAEYWCDIAQQIGCSYLIAVPSRHQDESDEEIQKDAVQMLQKLSAIGEKYHVDIALEFIGFEEFSVRTLSFANKIIQEVNRKNVGLVVDTYHFYIGNSSYESVEEVNKEDIFIFHVNDAEKGIEKENLTEDHRVFPGLGSMPLEKIGQQFKKIGFDKHISMELFRKDYWEMEKNELAEEA